MNNDIYNFNSNLLKLSSTDIIEDAYLEWFLILYKRDETNNNKCICQHKIKRANYLYNIKTKYTITCGTTCLKKFNFKIVDLTDNILKTILNNHLQKGQYENIDNIINFSENIEDDIIEHYTTQYNYNKNNLQRLLNYKTEIDNLICSYSLIYLNDILIIINNQINILEEENKQNELLKIKKQNEKDEITRINKLKIQNKQDDKLNIINYKCRLCNIVNTINNKIHFFNNTTCYDCQKKYNRFDF
jgi:hypothetical protein